MQLSRKTTTANAVLMGLANTRRIVLGDTMLDRYTNDEIEVVLARHSGVTVSIAPGLGQPRPNRRGEARGLVVYEIADDSLIAQTYTWRDADWGLTAVRRFPRGREPLALEPA